MKRFLMAFAVIGLLAGHGQARADQDPAVTTDLDPSQIEIIAVKPRAVDSKPIISSLPVNGDQIVARNSDTDRPRTDAPPPKSGT